MTLIFYNTILVLGIRECNEVLHTIKEVPGPLSNLQSGGLQEPEVSVDVVRPGVGGSRLSITVPSEAPGDHFDSDIRAALHSCTFSSAKRVCKWLALPAVPCSEIILSQPAKVV